MKHILLFIVNILMAIACILFIIYGFWSMLLDNMGGALIILGLFIVWIASFMTFAEKCGL